MWFCVHKIVLRVEQDITETKMVSIIWIAADVVRCNGQEIGKAGMLLAALVFPLQCVVLQRDNNNMVARWLRDACGWRGSAEDWRGGREKGENPTGGLFQIRLGNNANTKSNIIFFAYYISYLLLLYFATVDNGFSYFLNFVPYTNSYAATGVVIHHIWSQKATQILSRN